LIEGERVKYTVAVIFTVNKIYTIDKNLLENLPSPLLIEGNYPSLWQREVRRDFPKNIELIF